MWKTINTEPRKGRAEDIEDRLKRDLPGAPTSATVGSALRILERHGMLVVDGDTGAYVASRPEPGLFAPLDVQHLARRADVERGKLRKMIDYAYWMRCRRQFVLEYFGDSDWRDRDRRCGSCDNCDVVVRGNAGGTLDDGDKRAIRVLLLLIEALRGRFGRMKIAKLAIGDIEDDGRFDDLAARNCLGGWTQKQVLDLLRAAEGAGLVEASRGEYPTISTTRRGHDVALGKIDPDGMGIQMPSSIKGGKAVHARRRRR
jgi:ATP-dependent DNA helicase RecQ